MKKPAKIPLTSPLFFLLTLIIIIIIPVHSNNTHIDPSPTLWPEKFHALLYMNLTDGKLQITDLWYDWPKGRNLNLMQKQLGDLLHDVEWNNGTSYYYTEGPTPTCRTMEFEVGIPRPNWLAGSTYLGTRYTDGFLCHVWEKVDFIWYYEDVNTRQPVRWDFYDGISTHVITYEIGASLEDSKWQAPPYCFNSDNNGTAAVDVTDGERKIRNGKDQRNIGGLTGHSLRKLVNE